MDDEDSKLMKAVVQLAEAQSKAKAAIVEADVIKQKFRYIQEDFEKERADFQLREQNVHEEKHRSGRAIISRERGIL